MNHYCDRHPLMELASLDVSTVRGRPRASLEGMIQAGSGRVTEMEAASSTESHLNTVGWDLPVEMGLP